MNSQDRVLVVDDDPALRSLLSDYLTDVGFSVDLAADGEQMRRALSKSMPDVIVLDLMLPGTDGLALTREVRATSNVPILMLSARGEEIDRVVGLESWRGRLHRQAVQPARIAGEVARPAASRPGCTCGPVG